MNNRAVIIILVMFGLPSLIFLSTCVVDSLPLAEPVRITDPNITQIRFGGQTVSFDDATRLDALISYINTTNPGPRAYHKVTAEIEFFYADGSSVRYLTDFSRYLFDYNNVCSISLEKFQSLLEDLGFEF